MISYEVEKDSSIIIYLSKGSKPGPRLRFNFDNVS